MTEEIIVSKQCLECGFCGDVLVKKLARLVQCPECKTVNDFWLEDECVPKRHVDFLNKIKEIVED